MHRIAVISGGAFPEQFHKLFEGVDIYESLSVEQMLDTVKHLCEEKYIEAIICVTGVAETLRSISTIPVFICDPSSFDVVETLRDADVNLSGSWQEIALVINRKWDIDVERFLTYINNKLSLHQYSSEEEIPQLMSRLVGNGISTFIGGPTVCAIAKANGISGFFLQVGEFALRQSIRHVNDSLDYANNTEKQNERLEKVLDLSTDASFITDKEFHIITCNESASILFKRYYSELEGVSMYDLFKGNNRITELLNQRRCKDKLVEFEGKSWFLSVEPLFDDDEEQGCVVVFRNAEEIEQMEHKFRRNRSAGMVAKFDLHDILSQNAAMNSVKDITRAFAATDSTVLIRGETGVGKELFAHSIHRHSPRRRGPFVAVNCAALPENLLESELMGYEEGAFTSAKRGGKAGLFELAHTGTIFLDEISQVPIHMQGSILRVLQEKQVLRLGGSRIIPVDVRIIAASNEDLLTLVRQGKMRQDLYYRLNVLKLNIPALRDRIDDIPLLIDHYFKVFSRKYGSTTPMSNEAIAVLQQYNWPGNVRELINCVERYVIISRQLGENDMDFVHNYVMSEQSEMMSVSPLASGHVSIGQTPPQSNGTEAADIPSPPQKTVNEVVVKEDEIIVKLSTLDDMDSQIIYAVIAKCGGSKQEAAQRLAISRPTLLKKYDPQRKENCPGADGTLPADCVTVKISALEEMENKLINETLERCRGSRKEAASDLGISRSTLWKRIQ